MCNSFFWSGFFSLKNHWKFQLFCSKLPNFVSIESGLVQSSLVFPIIFVLKLRYLRQLENYDKTAWILVQNVRGTPFLVFPAFCNSVGREGPWLDSGYLPPSGVNRWCWTCRQLCKCCHGGPLAEWPQIENVNLFKLDFAKACSGNHGSPVAA